MMRCWTCPFCGSVGFKAWLAWKLWGTRKLHRCDGRTLAVPCRAALSNQESGNGPE